MPKRGFLGCSFPVIVGIFVALLVLTVVSLLSGALGGSLFGDMGLPDWLTVPKPHVQLPAEEVFHLFGFPVTNSLITSWFSMIVLIGIAYAVTHRIKLIPSRLQSLVESALGWMLNLCQDVAGEKNGRRFFPVVTTIFLFVLMNAWLSLVPGFGSILVTGAEGEPVHLLRGANTDINTPLALALISFVFVEYLGISSLGGLHYVRKFVNVGQFFRGLGQLFRGKIKAGFVGVFKGCIDIFVGGLEALSELVRILSFTFRLFGNMTGGEILILMMLFLAPWVLAIPFYGLELLVGLVQALIFGGLTLVFATIAVTPHGE
ncbi:F0F1 ATP synthase subunit A [Chloroflexota bacterium]